MGRSLLIKLALLAGTVALVLWIGWPTTQDSPSNPLRVAAQASATLQPDHETPQGQGTGIGISQPRGTDRAPQKARLDINRATIQELRALPGIGEVLAQRVVEYRGAHGPFRTVEGLLKVKGIGPKRMDQLRPLLVVEAPVSSPQQTFPSSREAATKGERHGL
jgi:competence protein ComEA